MKDSFTNNLNHLWKLFSQVLLQLIGKGIVVIMYSEADLGLLQHPRWSPAVNYYHKALYLGCCSNPRSTSGTNATHWELEEACNFIKKETLAQVFSCEFCEISKNTFFTEHLWAAASKTIPWTSSTRVALVHDTRTIQRCTIHA